MYLLFWVLWWKGCITAFLSTSAAIFVSLPEGWQRAPFHLEDYEAIMVNSSTRLGWHRWSFHLLFEVLKHYLRFSCSLSHGWMFSKSREQLLARVVEEKSFTRVGREWARGASWALPKPRVRWWPRRSELSSSCTRGAWIPASDTFSWTNTATAQHRTCCPVSYL